MHAGQADGVHRQESTQRLRSTQGPARQEQRGGDRERGENEVREKRDGEEGSEDAAPAVDEVRDFMQVVYRALLMVARYLQKRYGF
jgi:hypothetical protein